MPIEKTPNNKDILTNISLQFFLPENKGVNWDIATSIAFNMASNPKIQNRDAIQETYEKSLDIIGPLVTENSGLSEINETHLIVCNRHEWIVNTIDGIAELFDDLSASIWTVLEKNKTRTITKKASKALATSEIGLLLGYISQKVLGQYDIGFEPEKDANLLLIVEPNIALKERQLGLTNAPLRLWILAHEYTHKLQFENFSWIKEYYLSLIDELKNVLDNEIRNSKSLSITNISSIMSKKNFRLIGKIQALMSFIEGYADYVMFCVGESLPNHKILIPIFEHKQTNQNFLKNLLDKTIGLDVKKSQYLKGSRFVQEIDSLVGINFLNQNIDKPEMLPTLSEIKEPKKWLNRVGY